MNKFKEMIEGQSSDKLSADETFDKAYDEAQDLIKELQKDLKRFQKTQKKDPDNWGYAGTMKTILSSLSGVVKSL